jgi:hypothetical protein
MSNTIKDFYSDHSAKTYQYSLVPNGLDAFNWITATSRTPYLKLQLDGPWAEILNEAKQLDELFVPHRGTNSQGWSSLCLHGLGYDKTDTPVIYPEFAGIPESQLPYKWTEISERCPVATDYFKNKFPYRGYQRLRFMRLAPGGYIEPHVDGTNFMLAAVNISLNNPTGCEMVLENVGIVPFENSGSVMLFNTSHKHMVWNQGTEPRYHMIVHGQWAPAWSKIVVNSYQLML